MIAYDLLEEFKDNKNILKNFDERKIEDKYKQEVALWNPQDSILNNQDKDQRKIIQKRTKSTALDKLLETEGLL